METHHYAVLAVLIVLVVLALACREFPPQAPQIGKQDVTSPDGGGGGPVSKWLWVGPEIRHIPMSGAAWEDMLVAANTPTPRPDLSDQDDQTNVLVLAKALAYVRTGEVRYRTEVQVACIWAMGTEAGGRTLSLGRELCAYVIAADLVGLTAVQDAAWRAFLSNVRHRTLDGRTLVSTHEDRPNNWGTHAGASRLAVALYLDDRQEVERCAAVFRGWLGDRSAYHDFEYGDLSWQADPSQPVGVNPYGAMRDEHSIDGVLPDDQRRGGDFAWPPPREHYVWEALQGAIVQAVLLERAGYPAFEWSGGALLRAYSWLLLVADYYPTGDDIWQLPLVDTHYGTDFWRGDIGTPGKNMGWTAWTHGAQAFHVKQEATR